MTPMTIQDLRSKGLIKEGDTGPKTWGQISDEEKGALLLAQHERKTIQFLSSGRWWDLKRIARWKNNSVYRVKPEPVIETLVKYSGGKQKGWNSCKFSSSKYKMTYNLVDGEIDCNSFKVEKI